MQRRFGLGDTTRNVYTLDTINAMNNCDEENYAGLPREQILLLEISVGLDTASSFLFPDKSEWDSVGNVPERGLNKTSILEMKTFFFSGHLSTSSISRA